MELTQEQLLRSIWMALRRIEDNLALPPAPLELPEIRIDPPDLTDIVTAVTGLRAGATAEDIAEAIAQRLSLPTVPDSSGVMAEVLAELKTLTFRLQGAGQRAYVGGSVTLQPNQSISVANQLIPAAYDEIVLSYTGDNITGAVYKQGGSTVATLTMTYTGDNITRVVRT